MSNLSILKEKEMGKSFNVKLRVLLLFLISFALDYLSLKANSARIAVEKKLIRLLA
jgi:hypothetical protein